LPWRLRDLTGMKKAALAAASFLREDFLRIALRARP
jgi:hypothetical protein